MSHRDRTPRGAPETPTRRSCRGFSRSPSRRIIFPWLHDGKNRQQVGEASASADDDAGGRAQATEGQAPLHALPQAISVPSPSEGGSRDNGPSSPLPTDADRKDPPPRPSRPPSILRRRSVDDVPPLAKPRPHDSSDSLTATLTLATSGATLDVSLDDEGPCDKRITFESDATVFEFDVTDHETRNKWWSEYEMAKFRQEAHAFVHAYRAASLRGTKVIPTGTGRVLTVPAGTGGAASYCRDMFGTEGEGECEIKSVLVVDPHESILTLFAKSIRHMLPRARVVTARSAKEARDRIEAARDDLPLTVEGHASFDMIVVNERLGGIRRGTPPTSGSELISALAESEGRGSGASGCHPPLFVGVSARPSQDGRRLKEAGADLVWSMPPPEMNAALRERLVDILVNKRKRREAR